MSDVSAEYQSSPRRPTKAALHSEIALRYTSKKKRKQTFNFAAKRVNELKRLFSYRYGAQLPDDDSGRDDAFMMVGHLTQMPNATRLISSWLGLAAPWMSEDEIQATTAKGFANPIRWCADTAGKRLNLMEADRRRLGITTIGAVDLDKVGRQARRKERARVSQQQRRRATGATSRAEYEASSLTRAKPWEALGISRRTWYRRHSQASGTSACAA